MNKFLIILIEKIKKNSKNKRISKSLISQKLQEDIQKRSKEAGKILSQALENSGRSKELIIESIKEFYKTDSQKKS